MTPFAWGLLAVILIGFLLMLYFHEKAKEESAKSRDTDRWSKDIPDETFCGPIRPDKPIGLGAPIFCDGDKKKPITTLRDDDEVWCITPLGVMNGTIVSGTSTAHACIDCGILEITPRFVPDYFSTEMADKLGVPTAVWVVDDIRDPLKLIGYKLGEKSGIKPVSNFKMIGTKWIRDNSFFCDFLDIMVEELWFEFIFDGFDRSLEWYEGLEPLYEDGERSGGLETFLEAAPLVDIVSETSDILLTKCYEPPEVPPSYNYGVDSSDGGNSKSSYGGGDYSDSGGGDCGGGDCGGGDCGGGDD